MTEFEIILLVLMFVVWSCSFRIAFVHWKQANQKYKQAVEEYRNSQEKLAQEKIARIKETARRNEIRREDNANFGLTSLAGKKNSRPIKTSTRVNSLPDTPQGTPLAVNTNPNDVLSAMILHNALNTANANSSNFEEAGTTRGSVDLLYTSPLHNEAPESSSNSAIECYSSDTSCSSDFNY